MMSYFEQFGPVSKCFIKRHPNGNSRGFGFVSFHQIESLEKCVEVQSHWIDAKKVDIRRSCKNSQNMTALLKKLYVGNISFSSTEEKIESYFSSFGEIDSINIARHPLNGQPIGFA